MFLSPSFVRLLIHFHFYTTKLNKDTKPIPPLNITTEELPIASLCDILMYYELANKVDNSSDLSTLLRQNVHDSCRSVSQLSGSCINMFSTCLILRTQQGTLCVYYWYCWSICVTRFAINIQTLFCSVDVNE